MACGEYLLFREQRRGRTQEKLRVFRETWMRKSTRESWISSKAIRFVIEHYLPSSLRDHENPLALNKSSECWLRRLCSGVWWIYFNGRVKTKMSLASSWSGALGISINGGEPWLGEGSSIGAFQIRYAWLPLFIPLFMLIFFERHHNNGDERGQFFYIAGPHDLYSC